MLGYEVMLCYGYCVVRASRWVQSCPLSPSPGSVDETYGRDLCYTSLVSQPLLGLRPALCEEGTEGLAVYIV